MQNKKGEQTRNKGLIPQIESLYDSINEKIDAAYFYLDMVVKQYEYAYRAFVKAISEKGKD
ncbi:MAG: hypothetical protein M1536_03730 [Firmicutes bacterium]|nr:hypothetical protein [Bacillota bacterium]